MLGGLKYPFSDAIISLLHGHKMTDMVNHSSNCRLTCVNCHLIPHPLEAKRS